MKLKRFGTNRKAYVDPEQIAALEETDEWVRIWLKGSGIIDVDDDIDEIRSMVQDDET